MTPDLRRALRFTLLWGLDGVVLRSVGSARVPDLNEAQLRIRLESEEVDIAAVDPGLFESPVEDRAVWMDDLQQLDDVVAFCRRFDCSTILTGGFPTSDQSGVVDILKRAASRIGDLKLAIRSADRPSDHDLAEILSAVDNPQVTACWDPAKGPAPLDRLDAVKNHLGVIIVRDVDASGNRANFAEGVVPWREILERLVADDYTGVLAMDLTGATPRDALRSATSLLYMIREVKKTT